MSYLSKKTQQSTNKSSKTSKTLSMPIGFWAAVEQIRNKRNQKDFETTIDYCIMQIYENEGFGLP